VPAARRRANDAPPKAPTPLAPLVGNMWMPVWAVRPGSYTALGLLFEVKRGVEPKTKRHRPPARWALDPFTDDLWREKAEVALVRVAEEDGHDGRWLRRAVTALEAFARRSRFLMAAIRDDMPIPPSKPRRRRKKKRNSGPHRS
jgi:hypothetical protein